MKLYLWRQTWQALTKKDTDKNDDSEQFAVMKCEKYWEPNKGMVNTPWKRNQTLGTEMLVRYN